MFCITILLPLYGETQSVFSVYPKYPNFPGTPKPLILKKFALMGFRSCPKSRFLVTKQTNVDVPRHTPHCLFLNFLNGGGQVGIPWAPRLSLTHQPIARITASGMLHMLLFVLALLFLQKRVYRLVSNANPTKRDRIIQDLPRFCVGYFFFWRGTSWIYF